MISAQYKSIDGEKTRRSILALKPKAILLILFVAFTGGALVLWFRGDTHHAAVEVPWKVTLKELEEVKGKTFVEEGQERPLSLKSDQVHAASFVSFVVVLGDDHVV